MADASCVDRRGYGAGMALAIVTGASSGIGKATAIELARRGYHLVAAGRSPEKTEPVIGIIESLGGTAEFLLVDLASLNSAREAAMRFEDTGREVDLLVNNAGIGATRGVSGDGFEIHFAVNHLGHFQFTHHLRRTFRPGTRIVQVSSSVHHRAEGIDLEQVRRPTSSLFGIREYAVSKLANVLYARHLATLQPDWRTYAVHPGLTNTGIIPAYVKPFMRRLLTPEEGAEPVVWCATAPELSEESGHYYARMRPEAPSAVAQDDHLAADLWRRSEMWCGVAPQY